MPPAGLAFQHSQLVVSDVGNLLVGPNLPLGYPRGMQQWNSTSGGIPNIAYTRSITCGCSVVSTDPIPSARAASRRFCTGGNTE